MKVTTAKPEYYYHGTIDKFVPAILKEGLKPINENAWDGDIEGPFHIFNPKKDEAPGYIFITQNVDQAVKFARSKADYFRAEPDSKVEVYDMDMVKSSKAPVIEDAEPVIVTVSAKTLKAYGIEPEPDPHSSALRYHGSIPPKAIYEVGKLV